MGRAMKNIFDAHLYDGQTALITGGGTGIGLAIARQLGQLGAHVILAARDLAQLQQAANQLQDERIQARAETVNIRDADSVQALFDRLEAADIAVDCLVNNAGGQFASAALDISPNGFRAVVELNLQGTFQMSQRYAQHCQQGRHGGSILNIVLCLEQGIPGMAHAAAARAGVVNLTKTLAWEWAPLDIRVNAVAPGTIRTSGLDRYDPEQLQRGVEKLLIPRMGTPEEVACSVAYLCSPAASFITGICLAQDGGEHLTGASPQN